MARPKKQVDADLVRKLAAIHCTVAEIATACGCSKDTLERRFSDMIDAGRNEGKASLRRLQWQTAQKGNATMQIWLGKQLLGQRDKHVDEVPFISIESKPLTNDERLELIKATRAAINGKA